MIAIGIPSYNEADNIAVLVRKIDRCAIALRLKVLIINADNTSPDGTSEIFKSTITKNQKISLLTRQKGKGRNVFALFQFVSKRPDIDYCFLVDADVTSFQDNWLESQYEQYKSGADYVLPNYKRRYIEGNATNQFSYPIMRHLLGGTAPRQPLAGDIGLSRGLIKYLLGQPRHISAYGYGIDMFIAINAVAYQGTISEIELNEKIHKPSFPKMIHIFKEEAASCYFARRSLGVTQARFVTSNQPSKFLEAKPIPSTQLKKRLEEARSLHKNSKSLIKGGHTYFDRGIITEDEWVSIIVAHDKLLYTVDPVVLADSLTPYYLLRVVSYLKHTNNAKAASIQVQRQALKIQNALDKLSTTKKSNEKKYTT